MLKSKDEAVDGEINRDMALRGEKMWDLSHYTEQETLKDTYKMSSAQLYPQGHCMDKHIVWKNMKNGQGL